MKMFSGLTSLWTTLYMWAYPSAEAHCARIWHAVRVERAPLPRIASRSAVPRTSSITM